jgi:hypothetical protein
MVDLIENRSDVAIFEFELLPLGLLENLDIEFHPCGLCGRVPAILPSGIRLVAGSVKGHIDIFRVQNFPTVIMATDRFVEAVQELGLTGLGFKEVRVL